MPGVACLLDSNILLRISKSDDPQHPAISRALHALFAPGVRLCYTSQTLGEFWNASTRPFDKNGFGDRKDFELLPTAGRFTSVGGFCWSRIRFLACKPTTHAWLRAYMSTASRYC
jgi:hypothetical protein